MMRLIFFSCWRICLLQENPENIPYSPFLASLGAFLLVLILMIQWQFSDSVFVGDFATVLMASSSLILSYIVYTYVLLFFRGLAPRLIQTLTCLFGTRIIIHILASPLLLLYPYLSHVHLKNLLFLFIGVVYLFITLGLSVWQFVITAHIYKYALNISAIHSVLAAFGVLAVNILTVSLWR